MSFFFLHLRCGTQCVSHIYQGRFKSIYTWHFFWVRGGVYSIHYRYVRHGDLVLTYYLSAPGMLSVIRRIIELILIYCYSLSACHRRLAVSVLKAFHSNVGLPTYITSMKWHIPREILHPTERKLAVIAFDKMSNKFCLSIKLFFFFFFFFSNLLTKKKNCKLGTWIVGQNGPAYFMVDEDNE